jgi:tRNA(adenine34) deaminase
MGIVELDPPMHRAVELAWESFCAGSLGVGAVMTRNDEIVATGRNRLAESDPGDDVLAGTSLAHAELNALARLRWGGHADGLQLWTTLQPRLQCLGAIRLSVVAEVHVLAPDPLFRGVEGARHLNPFIGSRLASLRPDRGQRMGGALAPPPDARRYLMEGRGPGVERVVAVDRGPCR